MKKTSKKQAENKLRDTAESRASTVNSKKAAAKAAFGAFGEAPAGTGQSCRSSSASSKKAAAKAAFGAFGEAPAGTGQSCRSSSASSKRAASKTAFGAFGEAPAADGSVFCAAGPQRLDKLLGQEGLGTRSELKKAIRRGRASVNGTVEKDPGRQITAGDEVTFDGKKIRREQYVYYMLNKPAGVVTATEDRKMRTVLDLLREPIQANEGEDGLDAPEGTEKTDPRETAGSDAPKGTEKTDPRETAGSDAPEGTEKTDPRETAGSDAPEGMRTALTAKSSARMQPVLRKGLFPVGRLDRDTEGLLLITDDGQLAHRLLSPTRHVDKTYFAVVTGRVTEEEIRLFADGFRVDDELTAMPAVLRIAGDSIFAGDGDYIQKTLTGYLLPGGGEVTEYTQVYVTIREGKFHQIKRMFAAVGKEVLYLKRLSMGSLKLDTSLKPGQFRELTEEEIAALREH